eukprot:1159725-Pelagomonas_calceolata.AAC.4
MLLAVDHKDQQHGQLLQAMADVSKEKLICCTCTGHHIMSFKKGSLQYSFHILLNAVLVLHKGKLFPEVIWMDDGYGRSKERGIRQEMCSYWQGSCPAT